VFYFFVSSLDKLNATRSLLSTFQLFSLRKIFLKTPKVFLRSFFIPTLGNRAHQVLFKISFSPILDYIMEKNFFYSSLGKSHFDFLNELFFKFSSSKFLYTSFAIFFDFSLINNFSRLTLFSYSFSFGTYFLYPWLNQLFFSRVFPNFIKDILMLYCFIGFHFFLFYKTLFYFSTFIFDFYKSVFCSQSFFLILSRSIFILNLNRIFMEEFLFFRSVSFFEFRTFFLTRFFYFSFLNHNFYFYNSFCLINLDLIKKHKRDLKLLFLSLKTSSIYFLSERFNNVVLNWLFRNSYFLNSYLCYSLDCYFFSLFKKFLKSSGFWHFIFFYSLKINLFSFVFIILFYNSHLYFFPRYFLFNFYRFNLSVFFYKFNLFRAKKIKKFFLQRLRQESELLVLSTINLSSYIK
jgi:hypothetical protein